MAAESGATPTYRRTLTHPLAAVLFIAGLIYIAAALILPINQLTQTTSTATMNVDPQTSQQVLDSVPGLLVDARLEPVAPNGLTVSVVTQPSPGEASVPTSLKLLSEAGTALWSLAAGLILITLALIVGTIARGFPFDRRNSLRMVIVAGLLIVASLGADTLNLINAQATANYISLTPPLVVVAYYSWLPVLAAVIALVFAMAFRRGQQIQDDVDGLV